jgi:hypothetical protein
MAVLQREQNSRYPAHNGLSRRLPQAGSLRYPLSTYDLAWHTEMRRWRQTRQMRRFFYTDESWGFLGERKSRRVSKDRKL